MNRPWKRIGFGLWLAVLIWAAVLLGWHLRLMERPFPRVLSVQELANGFAASTIAPIRLPPAGAPLSGRRAPAIRLFGLGGPGNLGAYRGQVTLVTFVDPGCRGACEGTVSVIRQALSVLRGERPRIAVLAVSVTSSGIGRSRLLAWWEQTGIGRPGALLIGSRQQVHAVLKAYGIAVQAVRGGVQWTPALYVLNGRGQGERLFIVNPHAEASEEAALVRAIRLGLPAGR
jgi:hypothetical protein